VFLSTDELERLPPFQGRVRSVLIVETPGGMLVAVRLALSNGEFISFGEHPADDKLVGFARTLREGHVYVFPQAWQDYVGKSKETNKTEKVGSEMFAQ